MRILAISPRGCWPPNNGARLREFHLLRVLSHEAQVSLLTFQPHEHAGMNQTNLPFCHRVVAMDRPKAYTPQNVVRGLTGATALPVLNYTSAQMRRSLEQLLAEERFDVVQIESIHMTAYRDIIGRAAHRPLVVFDWHNIESELMERFSEGALGPKRWYAMHTARQLAAAEQQALREADGHVVCSEREKHVLQGRHPQARIEVVDNGVDTLSFTPAPEGAPVSRILFVGLMSYHANVDAALYFTREIWPRLRSQLPGMRLTIVGSHPTREVRNLARQPDVEVTGTVPDVRPYYREAAAAVVPLRTGGGTRLKILEAMAGGVPVVSTSIGAEGLAVRPGLDVLIADRDEDWGPQLRQAIDQRASLTQHGLELVRKQYDWQVLGERLAGIYRAWAAAPST